MASEWIACCGLYCGACSFRLAAEEQNAAHLQAMPSEYDRWKAGPLEHCPGCRLENQCGQCAIRDCVMGKGLNDCSQCGQFPCEILKAFNNDGKPHHGEVLQNLELLRQLGEGQWLEYMRKKWTCGCGVRKSWYYAGCTCEQKTSRSHARR